MPKRAPTPETKSDSAYFSIHNPWPVSARFEEEEDPDKPLNNFKKKNGITPPGKRREPYQDAKELVKWVASVLGSSDDIFSIYYKPKSPSIVILELNAADYTQEENIEKHSKLLGSHRWIDCFAQPPSGTEKYKTQVFYCHYQHPRKVEKAGWKEIAVQGDWFDKFYPDSDTMVRRPYPTPEYCEIPAEDTSGIQLCKELPKELFPAYKFSYHNLKNYRAEVAEEVKKYAVGSPEWHMARQSGGLTPSQSSASEVRSSVSAPKKAPGGTGKKGGSFVTKGKVPATSTTTSAPKSKFPDTSQLDAMQGIFGRSASSSTQVKEPSDPWDPNSSEQGDEADYNNDTEDEEDTAVNLQDLDPDIIAHFMGADEATSGPTWDLQFSTETETFEQLSIQDKPRPSNGGFSQRNGKQNSQSGISSKNKGKNAQYRSTSPVDSSSGSKSSTSSLSSKQSTAPVSSKASVPRSWASLAAGPSPVSPKPSSSKPPVRSTGLDWSAEPIDGYSTWNDEEWLNANALPKKGSGGSVAGSVLSNGSANRSQASKVSKGKGVTRPTSSASRTRKA